jgi:hypothetical protein
VNVVGEADVGELRSRRSERGREVPLSQLQSPHLLAEIGEAQRLERARDALRSAVMTTTRTCE